METKRSRGRWGRLLVLALALAGLANAGCLVVAAGAAAGAAAAGYAYYKGKICQTYSANFDDAWAAVRTALADLGMPIVGEERNAESGSIETRTGHGEKVRIHLDQCPSKFPAEGPVTRVCVRVATFGDEAVSERILAQVGAHLVPVPMAATMQPPPAGSAISAPAPPAAPVLRPPQPAPPGEVRPPTPPPPLAN